MLTIQQAHIKMKSCSHKSSQLLVSFLTLTVAEKSAIMNSFLFCCKIIPAGKQTFLFGGNYALQMFRLRSNCISKAESIIFSTVKQVQTISTTPSSQMK